MPFKVPNANHLMENDLKNKRYVIVTGVNSKSNLHIEMPSSYSIGLIDLVEMGELESHGR
jgi:hypothetical protein